MKYLVKSVTLASSSVTRGKDGKVEYWCNTDYIGLVGELVEFTPYQYGDDPMWDNFLLRFPSGDKYLFHRRNLEEWMEE